MSTAVTSNERLIIRASAGTGKTFQLTNRYLRQLHAGASNDEILATTFTRKAAGEILERVMQRLALAARTDDHAKDLAAHLDAPDFDRPRAVELLAEFTRSLHHVHICTLDALFLRVAMSMSLELGLMPGWSIIEQTDDVALRDRAIDSMIQNGQNQDIVNLTRLLAKGEYRQTVAQLLRTAVQDVHNLAQVTSPSAWDWFPQIYRMSDDDFAELMAVFPDIPVGSRGDKAHATAVADATAENWDAFFARGLAPKIIFENSVFYGKELPADGVEAYRRVFERAAGHYYDIITTHTRATRQLADKFEKCYEMAKHKARGLMFDDVPRLLVQSLGDAEAQRVAYRMSSNVAHVLLDEFQDTSIMQWHAVRALVLGRKGSRLKSFFCVGDTKQAIYGWRGGVAEIFDAVPDEIPNIEEAPLNKSRRSWPAIIETVNTVFSTLPTLNDLEDYEEPVQLWSQRFTEHETAFSTEPDAENRGYACVVVSPDPEDPADSSRTLYEFVADEVVRLCEKNPGRTVGVLTRRNEFASRVAFQLRKRGIPASEEGGSAIADSAAVLAMLSLLQLADHPGDTAARFHVAITPLGAIVGLTDYQSELEAVRCAERTRRRLAENGYGATLYELTERMLGSCSMRDIVRLRQVIEVGWRFDQNPTVRTRDFIRIIESQRVESPTEDRVRVMTIHKSKGLEFDIVVLPELNYQDQFARVAWAADDKTESPDRVCMHIKRVAQEILPAEFREVFAQTRNRGVIESLCLLYVGMTRAAHALHMIVEPDGDLKRKRKYGQKWYARYAGLLRECLCLNKKAEAGATLFERGNPDWHAVDIAYREQSDAAEREPIQRPETGLNLRPMADGRRRGLQRTAPSVHRTSAIRVDQLLTAGSSAARLRGSVVHKWFEQIVWLDDVVPTDDDFFNSLDEPAFSELDLDGLLAEFHKVLESKSVIQALSRDGYLSSNVFSAAEREQLQAGSLSLEVYNERQFAIRSDSELISGTIDRLVLLRGEQGVVGADIIDFKTDQARTQKQLRKLKDVYAEQLAVYRSAVGQMYGLPESEISARLLMTEAGVVLDV